MRVGVITFPGTLDDVDAARAVEYAGGEAVRLWHADHDLKNVDAVIVPGGFSYGDYLRCGAIARFAPVMQEVIDAAKKGMPVLGICNGFQILCEAHLLPGALIRNHKLHFVCRDQWLKVENNATAWTSRYDNGAEILVPLKSGEGGYQADQSTLDELEGEGRVVFRYVVDQHQPGEAGGDRNRYVGENPNGSRNDIAGITSANGRIVGLMPHPEHAIDALTGPTDDGLGIFLSLVDSVVKA
ncbi:phosphoribosylformylglycinamidine synthase [Saccharothrix ecbatanensis]|uniref:Phosphoribosylformylglycinamidine synthase subunit PurQ n=1 Tax=Saccharothrix ecbatanensis TaxID=1105145 RepID=A0A7W9HRB7_9PSEU|nr:phosphoribosylformylglycinamidine synthase subunit PurQ [Saccharothrix ecbatanensis]MBB5806514.1 phosphoribosylformylglycinamidine synthase [Saccharothrix ecbatanensis]